MALNDSKILERKKQVEKNTSFDNDKKSENPRNILISFGKDFCSLINSLPDSPWQKQKDPISILKENYNIKSLSQLQKNFIKFAHHYFCSNKPLFFKRENIARHLGMEQIDHVSRLILTLEKKEIIVKANWKSGKKGHGYKILILPNIPKINQRYKRILEKNDSKKLKKCKKIGILKDTSLICNSPELQANFQHLIKVYNTTNIIVENTDVLSKEIKKFKDKKDLRSLDTNKNPVRVTAVVPGVFSSKQRNKPMRLILKRKENFESKEIKSLFPERNPALRDKFKKTKITFESEIPSNIKNILNKYKETKHLTNPEIKTLDAQFGMRYGCSLNDLFKNRENKTYGFIQQKLFDMFLEIFENNKTLDYKNTSHILNIFNKMDNKKFSHTNTNLNNKTYMHTVVAVSYWSLVKNISNNNFCSAIKRLNNFSEFRCFKHLKKIKLLDLLTVEMNKRNVFEIFSQEEEKNFRDMLFYKEVKKNDKYEAAQQEWARIFVSMYPDKEQGKEQYNKNKYRLVSFLNDLLDDAIFNKRDMCGLSFKGKNTITKEYLQYLLDDRARNIVMVKDICSHANWQNFIENKRQEDYEFENLWRYYIKEDNDF